MLRRLRDAILLDLLAVNAYHVTVACCRYYDARRWKR